MSFTSPISAATSPVVDQATEPAAIRNGNQAAKNAYATGTAFEQMLVSELTQQLTATISGSGSSDDGLGGTTADATSDGTDGASTDPAVGAYSSMLPDALTSGIMSTGGTGIAMQIAEGIDPSLANAPSTSTSGTSTSGTTSTPSTPTASSTGGAGLTDPTASEVGA